MNEYMCTKFHKTNKSNFYQQMRYQKKKKSLFDNLTRAA